jgi:hypothetical protein
MVTIRIGNDSRRLEDADESWITQQIVNRQREGLPVCVEVMINTGTLNVRLSTPACGGGSGGRAPRPDEAAIIDLWSKHKLNLTDFSGGSVIAFIKQLGRLL